MATTKKQADTTTENVVQFAKPVTVETVEQLKAEAKRATEALRAAKAALSKKTPLETVLEKQSHGVTDQRARQYFIGLVRSRVKAGQDRETALSAVVEMFTDFLIAEVANE